MAGEWIFTEEELCNTPSITDGVTVKNERIYRFRTAWFIEELAKELRGVRIVLNTALVLFHRFFVFQSFKKHNRFVRDPLASPIHTNQSYPLDNPRYAALFVRSFVRSFICSSLSTLQEIAAACIFLASKVEEKPLRLREVAAAFTAVKRKTTPLSEAEAKSLPNVVLAVERILLQTLCFDMMIAHPHSHIQAKINGHTHTSLRPYIKEEGDRDEIKQCANFFLNDSYRTTVCLLYEPHAVAYACIYLSLLHTDVQPYSRSNNNVEWLDLFTSEIEPDLLRRVCEKILDVIDDTAGTQYSLDANLVERTRGRVQNAFYSYPKKVVGDRSTSDDEPMSKRMKI